jgi:hypothetical protein
LLGRHLDKLRDRDFDRVGQPLEITRVGRESAGRDDRIVVAAVTRCPLSWSTTIG